MKKALVDIVIVNWNAEAIFKSVQSIEDNKNENIGNLIIIDNNSSDNSLHC